MTSLTISAGSKESFMPRALSAATWRAILSAASFSLQRVLENAWKLLAKLLFNWARFTPLFGLSATRRTASSGPLVHRYTVLIG